MTSIRVAPGIVKRGPDLPSIGSIIRTARYNKHLSMHEAARKMGISVSHLCDIETGARGFSPDVFPKLLWLMDEPQARSLCKRQVKALIANATATINERWKFL